MTTFANLAINNGAATPVSKTFSKVKTGDGNSVDSVMAKWEQRDSGIRLGFETITQMMRFPGTGKGASRSTKVSVKITTPVMEVVSNSTVSGIAPAPTVAYRNLATIEVVLPERSTIDSRKDLYAFLVGYLAKPEFKDAIVNQDPVI